MARRSHSRSRSERIRTTRRRRTRIMYELLEHRRMLSTLSGVPIWTEAGPGLIPASGGAFGTSNSVGAINGVLPHPQDPNTLYVATVNGGIWKTSNANWPNDGLDNDGDAFADEPDEQPNWTPRTDRYPSLLTSEIAFDPTDPTYNTLWVSYGQTSSLNSDNSRLLGLMRSQNAGSTWEIMGNIQGENILQVIPTAWYDPGQVILAAAANFVGGGGIFRSADGGNTFGLVTLPGAVPGQRYDATDLISDPSSPRRFYAAVSGRGAFVTNDAGNTWTDLQMPGKARSVKIELSLHYNPTNSENVLYAAFTSPSASDGKLRLDSVFRRPLGFSWQTLSTIPAIHPGGQGYNHFSVLADPANSRRVFLGGDTGGIWWIDGTSSFQVQISDAGANGTAPHVDSRDMAFDAAGNLLEVDDGGIYRLLDPYNNERSWISLNGWVVPTTTAPKTTLRVTETGFAKLDLLNNSLVTGTQDNGNVDQRGSSLLWDDFGGSGDGGYHEIDNALPDRTTHYYNGNGDRLTRRVFDSNGQLIDGTPKEVPLASPATPTVNWSGLQTAEFLTDAAGNTVPRNDIQIAVHPQPQYHDRAVLYGRGLYESDDQGDTVSDITPLAEMGVGVALGGVAYGNRFGNNPDILYTIFNDRTIYVRNQRGQPATQLINYPGACP